jgi:hypothetical protein
MEREEVNDVDARRSVPGINRPGAWFKLWMKRAFATINCFPADR